MKPLLCLVWHCFSCSRIYPLLYPNHRITESQNHRITGW